ncbi:MAG TPA: DUF3368 domain-containing protein [Lentisphaeria bacterium]|nr:MAG: hypothetical protein A2X47_08020 [Lentisphaerae bacterium GWF2_38_69]HBM16428.1 DUF3368 domain-containing protein [Lentisphaeria bacterium]
MYVPLEVSDELNFKNSAKYGADIFNSTDFLKKETQYQAIHAYLKNSLDIGEASVIQCALSRNIQIVCIDEAVGRRIARLNSLKITGSLGIIVKAIKSGFKADFDALVRNMLARNIYLSSALIEKAKKMLMD